MNKKSIIVSSLAIFLSPLVCFAAFDLEATIDRFINLILLPVFSGLVIIMFIWVGILFLSAQGDPAKISTARKALIWVIVGIAVVLLANTIFGYVKKIVLG